MIEITPSQVLIRFPFCGVISRVSDRGFGFIDGPNGEEWIHVRDHWGERLNTMDGLVGKSVAFIVGGHPFRYTKQKRDWDRSVIEWTILEKVDPAITRDNYQENREGELLKLNSVDLVSLLASKWYSLLWKKSGHGKPKSVLKADEGLKNVIEKILSESNDLGSTFQLLEAISESPWYSLSSQDQERVILEYFTPDKWDLSQFMVGEVGILLDKHPIVEKYCGLEIKRLVQKTQSIAIDLESNKEVIFQIGWKNALGTGIRINNSGLTSEELDEAVGACLNGQTSPCIIGHNLLQWDWTILKQNNAPFPDSTRLWDTLIVSWLLEPWKISHALLAGEHAHQADVDATACYTLFNSQITQLGDCLDDIKADCHALIQKLFDDESLLDKALDRHYPNSYSQNKPGYYLLPSNRLGESTWQKNCSIKYLTPKNNLANPILSEAVCCEIAQKEGSLPSKVVAVVVSDAVKQGIEVRLHQLPLWLVDDTQRELYRKKHESVEIPEVEDSLVFLVAEDLFKLSDEEIGKVFHEKKVESPYPADILQAWQTSRLISLTELKVNEKFPGLTEGRSGRALLPVQIHSDTNSWLLYEPPGLKAKGGAWSELPAFPSWLDRNILSEKTETPDFGQAEFPRWCDGETVRLEINRIFVSPDTANRQLYLSDITHSVLNIIRTIDDGEVLIVGMRWSEEATQLQNNLVHLSISSLHKGTPLRKLEHVLAKGYKAVACAIRDIPKFIQATHQLGKKVKLVIDEVPLHNWFALLNSPDQLNLVDNPSEGGKANILPKNESDSGSAFGQVGVLSYKQVLSGTSKFLSGWLQTIIGSVEDPACKCLILDSRLSSNIAKQKTGQLSKDIPFYNLEELLSDDLIEVFYKICYPQRENLEIPNDYESYRKFLEENWGFKDFRKGTQRPAVEQIIENNHDILLRLPTGEGKSIIFHLPALLRSSYSGKLTLVITPLRALMRDQVEGLWQKHFTESVDYLSGGRDAWVNHAVYQGILDGRLRLVFVAPERFRVPQFADALERRRRMDNGLEFIVFDETHCVSEWGFEFRPDYLFAAEFVRDWYKEKKMPGNPHRLLLTSATVTQRNRIDLERELGLGKIEKYEDLPEDMPHPIQPFISLESFLLEENEEDPNDEKFERIIDIISELDLNESAALIFVRRRKDCHQISEALNDYASRAEGPLSNLHALPFHAGLPEAVKGEASDLLRAKVANVLVCTKAFGMGMDIPHLHTCIHHRPPTFIEDYLQEVGRIGRDEKERIKSGNTVVTANLLYNQENIEQNLSLLHNSTVGPPDLQDFFSVCLQRAIFFESVEKSLCIVPARLRINGTKAFDENQVTNCLFWLERMGMIHIEGKQPPFLDFAIDMQVMEKYTEGSSLSSQVAKAIIDILNVSRNAIDHLGKDKAATDTSTSKDEGIFGRVVRGILRGVLALVSPTQVSGSENSMNLENDVFPSDQEDGMIDVSISMNELMTSCGQISVDDLFLGLFELNQTHALRVKKTFSVIKGSLPSGTEFWNLLQFTINRLLEPTEGSVEKLPRKQLEEEMTQWYSDHLVQLLARLEPESNTMDLIKIIKRRVRREVYRSISTALKIVRYSGLEVKEGLNENGVAQYIRSVPGSSRNVSLRSAEETISVLKKLIDFVELNEPEASSKKSGEPFEIPLIELMEGLGPEVSIGQLKKFISLAESAGYYGFESGLSDWVSLITMNSQEELPPHNAEVVEETVIQNIYNEMLQRSTIQVLRAQSMVLLAYMPEEGRKAYIDRYFECVNEEDLRGLLEDTVGDVADEVLEANPMLEEILSQVRQERFTDEMKELNDSQLDVCKSPFDRNLLVNAGPGSGKTHVLMMRCAHLIHVQRIDPAAILVLAFNRAVVFEIRDRIRSLFRALGYGSYVNRLDVSTFHSFALRYKESTDPFEEDAIGQAVHSFAETMKNNPVFSQSIAGRYKAILVDEFQDMNEDFYGVVKNLISSCTGGGMVIGDDDQDILTWNRRRWRIKYNQECPLDAVPYFTEFQNSTNAEKHQLTLNYRSVPQIVERSNEMIVNVSKRVGFSRMKQDGILKAYRDEEGTVEIPLDVNLLTEIASRAVDKNENIAVLCRSNRECRQVYETLIRGGGVDRESIDLLGAEDFALYQLRHTGTLLDIIRRRKKFEFVESNVWDEILHEYVEKNFADTQRDKIYLESIYDLVKDEVGRPRVRNFQDFIGEMRGSDVDRLKAKFGLEKLSGKITVSTVHKVKGLQFDTVVVMPSQERFPFQSANGTQPAMAIIDSAEEARLTYVAMTRARNHLYVGWGDREKSWIKGSNFSPPAGFHQYFLKGSPKELFVSWPGRSSQVQKGLQNYIEKQVSLGDTLSVQGSAILHNDQTVGRLSQQTISKLRFTNGNSTLCVSNVIRYTCGTYFREKNFDFWEPLDEYIKKQGWFYIVLPEELIE